MLDFEYKAQYGFSDLVRVVALLRGPGGCPWDARQTHQSIRRNFIEETYEACEAIDQQDPDHLCEELGDVLLQVLFHASIEADAGRFTITDVCDGVVKKLIYRHPHVFGAVEVSGTDQVLANWETLKQAEKGQSTQTQVLEAVSRTLPALWRAEKVQKKAASAGAAAPDAAAAMQLMTQAVQPGQSPAEALGDAMFAAVAAARAYGSDPEDLLTAATDRFIRRFTQWEQTGMPAESAAPLWHTCP